MSRLISTLFYYIKLIKLGDLYMGEKRDKNNREFWTCIYCGYKNNKETLVEQGYMFKVKNDIEVCECPRCNCQQEVK